MKRKEETLFAVVAPGLEHICARELQALGMEQICELPGGVEFRGELRQIYLANLWCRTASRILVRFAVFRCRDFPALFNRVAKLPWGRFIKPGAAPQFRVTCHRSRLGHTGRIAEVFQQGCAKALGEAHEDAAGFEPLVNVRFEDDLCTVSVDSSGELLHRRGYREETAHAPLRETLAAGVLLSLGWDGSVPLYDPMCGSGTFLVEAALIAANRPPGQARSFAFMHWPGYRPGLWQALLTEAARAARPIGVDIRGSDRDASAVEAARRNILRSGFPENLCVQQVDLEELQLPLEPGWVVTNPPYGERVGAGEDLRPLYRRLGAICRDGWGCALVSPDPRLSKATGLELNTLVRLSNGGIEVLLQAAGPGKKT